MHSPASQHSSQSLPNSSPRSIHSPPGGYGNIKSPVPTPSPAGGLRSPCHMQSPINTPNDFAFSAGYCYIPSLGRTHCSVDCTGPCYMVLGFGYCTVEGIADPGNVCDSLAREANKICSSSVKKKNHLYNSQ
jgi:hypothetical protein